MTLEQFKNAEKIVREIEAIEDCLRRVKGYVEMDNKSTFRKVLIMDLEGKLRALRHLLETI